MPVNIIERVPDPPALQHPFGLKAAEEARAFHRTLPGYAPTPLTALPELAHRAGVAAILIKDESPRFGLNAFKGLGGSFAVAGLLSRLLGREHMTYAEILAAELPEITLITATDGNHGRGIAWTAHALGLRCVVYLPKGSAEERVRAIRTLGAEALVTDMNYDDTVRLAKRHADENGWYLVQDTAWEGYTDIPALIMQGYTTMGSELIEQLGTERPTHIFLQAGVGAMAGAMADFFSDVYRDALPVIAVAEPENAACVQLTAAANDGKLHTVGGDLATIMAGLSCGEPCSLGWEALRRSARFFASLPDSAAENAMRVLAHPIGSDPAVVSGESGAAGMALALEVLLGPDREALRSRLRIGPDSRILCISTEGATDRIAYERIVRQAPVL